MVSIKEQLIAAKKKTGDYLNYLEDGRFEHQLENLKGVNCIITKQNGGSANDIYIDERLLPNFNQFLKKSNGQTD